MSRGTNNFFSFFYIEQYLKPLNPHPEYHLAAVNMFNNKNISKKKDAAR